jgi:hypothetical protein
MSEIVRDHPKSSDTIQKHKKTIRNSSENHPRTIFWMISDGFGHKGVNEIRGVVIDYSQVTV